MSRLPTSGIPLFRLFGIQVYLHWTWFIVAWIQLQQPFTHYTRSIWNLAEYLSLFGIVLMHEFGHALACRSVGGRAERIMLWPFGGVAFVDPPQRPGAVLWSIVAGPLVNVLLLPVTIGAAMIVPANSNFGVFVESLAWINGLLLAFNMLPIYPLDGGQILRALLWFVIGPARSLMVATVIGLVGAAAGVVGATAFRSPWLVIIALFAAMQSWAGFQYSRQLQGIAAIPRRRDVRCPSCGASPRAGTLLMCTCRQPYDVFQTGGRCPSCGTIASAIQCPDCAQVSHPAHWRTVEPIYPAVRGNPA